MKIVSWNCHYEMTQKKMEALEKLDADIYVVQECTKADFDEVIAKKYDFKSWYGDSQEYSEKYGDLGISVFSNKCRIEFTDEFNRNFRYVVLFKVTLNGNSFILFAVWTKAAPYCYDKNIIEAYKFYQGKLSLPLLFIGDFNTYSHNDNDDLQRLENDLCGLDNVATQEQKNLPTYLHTDGKKGTDDFCFISDCGLFKKRKFKLGDWDTFVDRNNQYEKSDHCPIIVTFESS